ncbi:hypothetical protein L0F63_006629, partial [Massospora cicadina]
DGHYLIIDHVTPKAHKMLQKAHKREAAKAAALAASTINHSKIQEDIEEISRANQSEKTFQAEEDMEEII